MENTRTDRQKDRRLNLRRTERTTDANAMQASQPAERLAHVQRGVCHSFQGWSLIARSICRNVPPKDNYELSHPAELALRARERAYRPPQHETNKNSLSLLQTLVHIMATVGTLFCNIAFVSLPSLVSALPSSYIYIYISIHIDCSVAVL